MTHAFNDENSNKPPQPKKAIGIWSDEPLALGAFLFHPIPKHAKTPPLVGVVDFLETCRTCLLNGLPHPKLKTSGLYVRIGNNVAAATWQGLVGVGIALIAAWFYL